MTDNTVAPAGGDSTPIASSTPANVPEVMSAREAAQRLAGARWKRNNPEATGAEPAAEPAPEPDNFDAAPPQEAPGETPTEAQDEPAEEHLPPIDPPRSWSKEDKELFASYPREVQETLSRREQERDTALRRAQNEQAEKLKGLSAREQAAEQARKQYEDALPALMQALQTQQQGEFADIKTMADVERLAREDWPRYALWDAQQKKMAAVAQEMQAAQARQHEDFRQKWNDFATKQDQMFAEKAPEMADEKKRQSLMDGAQNVMRDLGFTDEELAKAWSGEASFSLRDHRVQLLIRDAVRLRNAQNLAQRPAPKTLPPVLKPGTAGARLDQGTLEINALQKRAQETGNARDYAKLLAAQRAQQRTRRAS